MKTEKIKVFECPPYLPNMVEAECIVLYEDAMFKMLFHNGMYNVELIIKNRSKTWHQWEFDVNENKAINYLGGKKLAKYKQDLIHQGFELMRKVEIEREITYQKKLDALHALRYPTTKEELDFLFDNKINKI